MTPGPARAAKIAVIVALACGATYLVAAGRDALTDRTAAARTASELRPAQATGKGERRAADRPPSALFIGDGWTAGGGDVDPQHSFACLTAAALGWICNNAGRPGTGYLAAGASGRPYAQRVAGYQRLYLADYVVVSGGAADEGAPLARRVTAAKRALDAVGAAFPRSRVVVVGPFAPGDRAGRDLRRFDAALAADVRRRGWLFVGTLDPPWIPARLVPGLMSAAGDVPTAAGHGHLAALLTTALRQAGVEPGERPAARPPGGGAPPT